MTHPGVVGAGLFALSLSLLAGTANAQDGGDVADEAVPEETDESADEETSRIHFQAGRAHFDAGRYEDALTEFVRAYEVSERHELLYNIALAHERLANYAEAADALETFNQTQAEPDATLTERVANLRRRAEARASGTDEEADAPAETIAPTPPPRDEGGGVSLPAIVSYAVAGAGLVTFGVFGALALAEDSSLAESCGADAGRACGSDDVSTLQTFSLVADIGLGVAVVGAIVGTVFLLLGGGDDEPEVALAPAVGPDVAGISARGRF